MTDRAQRARIREERHQRRQSYLLTGTTPFLRRQSAPTPVTQQPTYASSGSTPATATPLVTYVQASNPSHNVTNATRNPGTQPQSLEYIITDVFGFAPDGIMADAMDQFGVTTFAGLAALTINDIENMVYPVSQLPDENGDSQPDALRPLPFEMKAILKGFVCYITYRERVLHNPLTVRNCMDELSYDAFQDYRCSGNFMIFNNSPTGTPIIPSPIQGQPSTRTPAQEFNRSVKIDPSSYPTLKDDKGFDQFNRKLIAIARSHGTLHVLDPNYHPQSPDEIELFDRHLAFIYNVFTTHILTSKGKELVRKYQSTYDAQSVYDELREYHRESEKADGDKSSHLEFIMTHRLTTDTWFGTHDEYITHWNEQVRLYNDLETAAPLGEPILFLFLSNAVSLQPHLAGIKGTHDTLQAGTNGTAGALNFGAYCKLLHSAAQRYDRLHHPARKKGGNRKVYAIEQDDDSDFNDLFNIDTPISDIEQYRAFRAFSSRPRLPNAQWQKLSDEGRRLWHRLPDDAKEIILSAQPHPPPPPGAPYPRRRKLHEAWPAGEVGRDETSTPSNETSTTETTSDASTITLLTHATSQKSLPPGNLQRLMSNKMAKTPAITQPTAPSTTKTTNVTKHEVLIDDKGTVDETSTPSNETSTTETTSDASTITLLTHATSQKSLPPGNLQRLMSNKMAKTP